MSATSLLPLGCPAEQNNSSGLVLKPAHPAGSFAFPIDFADGIVSTSLPTITLPCLFPLVSQQERGFGI